MFLDGFDSKSNVHDKLKNCGNLPDQCSNVL